MSTPNNEGKGGSSGENSKDRIITPQTFTSFRAKDTTNDFVTKFRTRISGYLALGLWSSLVAAGAWHAGRVSHITDRMLVAAPLVQSDEDVNVANLSYKSFDKAFVMVGDAAKTLYAVISPLATAATGFYFVSQSTEQSSSKEEEEEE